MAWAKGQSGNPGGRGVEKPWAEALRRVAYSTDARGRRRLHRLAERCFVSAMNGDISAIREIGDRLDGKAQQDTMLTIDKREASDWTRDELIALLRIKQADEADNAQLVIEHEPVKKIA